MPDRNSILFGQFYCWLFLFVLFNAEHANMKKKLDPMHKRIFLTITLLYVTEPQPQRPQEVAVIISPQRITTRITFVHENESIIVVI